MNSAQPVPMTIYATHNPLYRWILARYRTAIRELLGSIALAQDSVLDVGSGEGFLMRYISAALPELKILGLDIDGKRLLVAKNMTGQCIFIQASAYNLPFVRESFDITMANEILEHCTEPCKALAEIARLTRRHIIISVPLEPYFSCLNFLRGAYIRRWGRTPAHANFWNRREFQKFLEDQMEIIGARICFPWQIAIAQKRNRELEKDYE